MSRCFTRRQLRDVQDDLCEKKKNVVEDEK